MRASPTAQRGTLRRDGREEPTALPGRDPTYCANPDCDDGKGFPRETEDGRTYCARCWKRKQRGTPMDAPAPEKLDHDEAVLKASTELENAKDDEADYQRKLKALWRRIEEAMEARGWSRPQQTRGLARARRPVRRARLIPSRQLELPLALVA